MAKGRPPDPTRAKRQTGHRPLPGQAKPVEVMPAAAFDTGPPASIPEDAHELWTIACDELAAKGLTAADLPLLEMMVTAAHRNRQARRILDKAGPMIQNRETGKLYSNPMLKVEKETAATYLRLAETLGLSPAARARLGFLHIAGQSMLVDIAERVAQASGRTK